MLKKCGGARSISSEHAKAHVLEALNDQDDAAPMSKISIAMGRALAEARNAAPGKINFKNNDQRKYGVEILQDNGATTKIASFTTYRLPFLT